jgi:hypothetical protein
LARSKTNYYNLCLPWWRPDATQVVIGDDGFCDLHRPHGRWNPRKPKCFGERDYESRRGVMHRQRRFPAWSWKSHSHNPPYAIKRSWRRKIRHREERELQRFGEILLDSDKYLRGLYGWWS